MATISTEQPPACWIPVGFPWTVRSVPWLYVASHVARVSGKDKKKDKRSPHESRILTNRVRETLHSATSKNECAEPPCAHVYARVHWLNFTAKHVRTVIRCRFGTYLWQIDGSLATQTIEIHRVARSVSSLRSVWVSALRCALREYFTRPSFAWQYLPKESTVEEWVEIRGGYRLPIWFEGGIRVLWICREGAWYSEGEPNVAAKY